MTTPNAKTARFVQVLQTIGCYFISLVLIAFAVSKFFDAQFQIYHHAGHMPLNDISPMTHAWSFFGRSYPYNLFLGIVEFLAGVFILFRRTRLLGLLIALGIYSNILIIDIEFQVYDALTHVVVEFIIVLLLLLPYVKDLATFFWSNMGRIHPTQTTAPKKWTMYMPWIFLIVICVGLLIEMNMALSTQDKVLGEYNVDALLLNKDTVALTAGKYTSEPMAFFEFGNVFILSANGKSNWADCFIQQDSIRIHFDKPFMEFQEVKGKLDRTAGRIVGQTDKGQSFLLAFSKVPPRNKK